MTMYDLVYEDDQSELYNVMLSPANTVDAMTYSDTQGWCCVVAKYGLCVSWLLGCFLPYIAICLHQVYFCW
jgi:hypothetical protein